MHKNVWLINIIQAMANKTKGMRLTFAAVLVECPDPASIVNQRPVIEQEGGGAVRKGPVIQMIQPAVVSLTPWGSQIQI